MGAWEQLLFQDLESDGASTDFRDNMDVTTGTNCCSVTTITSLPFIHDQIIVSITTVAGSQVKEDSEEMLVREIDKILSNEVTLWIIGVITVGLEPLLFLFGFPSNVLCAAVFCKLGLRERINLCVFALALTDLVTITVTFVVGVEWALRDLLGVELNFFIRYFVGPSGFLWASMFVSTTIACERCFCVVSPFKAQRYVKTSTTAVIITVATVVLAGGMWAIVGPKHEAVMVYDLATNTTRSVFYVTSYYLSKKEIIDIFDIFVYSILFSLVAIVVTVTTTAITAVKLHHAVSWRDQTTTSTVNNDTTKGKTSSKEVALTKMLIATSILFVVCITPVATLQIAVYFVKELNYNKSYPNLTYVVWNIITTLRMVNCSLNFYVYYKMGSKFRETLREMLRFRFSSTFKK